MAETSLLGSSDKSQTIPWPSWGSGLLPTQYKWNKGFSARQLLIIMNTSAHIGQKGELHNITRHFWENLCNAMD